VRASVILFVSIQDIPASENHFEEVNLHKKKAIAFPLKLFGKEERMIK